MQARPRSTKSFVTVFRAIPVIREVERMLFPSTRAAMTRTRSPFASVFIMSIMLEWNQNSQAFRSVCLRLVLARCYFSAWDRSHAPWRAMRSSKTVCRSSSPELRLNLLLPCGGCVDVNVRAFRVVQAALSEKTEPDARKVAARKGGLVGGPSRAKSISPARRREIAKQASRVRWSRKTTDLPTE
jgi:hypothetical protein